MTPEQKMPRFMVSSSPFLLGSLSLSPGDVANLMIIVVYSVYSLQIRGDEHPLRLCDATFVSVVSLLVVRFVTYFTLWQTETQTYSNRWRNEYRSFSRS